MGKAAEPGWFVIRTNPQSEKKADAELRRAGLRVYLPKRSYEVRNRRKGLASQVRWRPLLIGYLFVRFPDVLLDRMGNPPFGIIRACQGVKGFVVTSNGLGEWSPMSIPDHMVADFMRRQRRREFGRPAIVDPKKRLLEMRKVFRKGATVRITGGAFADFLATLERLNDDQTVNAELSLFGRPTPIRVSVTDVELESRGIDPRREAA